MTRLKAIATIAFCTLLAAWTHGFTPPASNTPVVFASPSVFVVDSSGNFLVGNDNTLAGSTYKLTCQGDSLTVYVGTVTTPYCQATSAQLLSGRSVTATWKPAGMIGYSWEYNYSPGPWIAQTIDSQGASQVDTEIYPGLTNVLVMFAGTNGIFLGGHSPAQEFTDFQTGYAARRAAGWAAANIIVVTILPRQDDSTFDTNRATYNASVKTFCGANGCKIADAGGDATIGCNGCEDNTTYYQTDKIHLNNTGQAYLATNLIYPQVP